MFMGYRSGRLISAAVIIAVMGVSGTWVGAEAAGETEPVLKLSHFPNRLHAFVWRNWESVGAERMAKVLNTTPESIRRIGYSMGLPPQSPPENEFLQRGYVSLIRRNWHLLSYDQLQILLGWDAAKLNETIQNEDFLWIKIGGLRPTCPPLQYTAPGEAELKRCAEIKSLVSTHFGELFNRPQEARFEFIKVLSAADSSRPTGALGVAGDDSIRFIYSYFAPYGDPLLHPELDPFPDGLLQRLSAAGVNGVWLHVVLNQLAPSEIFPEFGKDYEIRFENLRRMVQRAQRHGIKIYLYMNEPRGMSGAFFQNRDAIRGVHYTWEDNDLYAMCTGTPQVRQWMSDSLAYIFKDVPGLGGVFTITASENITNCWSSFNAAGCPRCSKRTAAEVISEVNRTIAEGVRRGNPEAKVIVWDWGWKDEWIEPIIKALPDNVYYMTVSEWDLPITRGGVSSVVTEYSLSAVGPSERSKKRWGWAGERGLKTLAKVQINTTWELSSLPYLPVMNLAARHCDNLAQAGVNGLMLSWSLGGCPSPNLEVAAQFSRRPRPSIDQALTNVAKNRYGDKPAGNIVEAWSQFSRAFAEYPFSQTFIYNGPMQVGPANLLYPEATHRKATMVGFPFDDLNGWKGIYPAEALTGQFEKMAAGWGRGLELFAQAMNREMTVEQKKQGRRDYQLAEAAGLYFKSCANQIRFILARDQLATDPTDAAQSETLIARIKAAVTDEMAIAERFFVLAREDSRFGFEASNQYNYLPFDFIEKVIDCDYILNHWLPGQSAPAIQ
jgi:hypothetical protein